MWRFAWTLLLVGVCSFAYHATNNFGTQLLDFIGMYVLVFLLVASNLHRIGLLPKEQIGRVHVGLILAGTLLVPVLRHLQIPYQLVVLAAILFIVGTELWLSRRPHQREGSPDFSVAVGLLTVAALCMMADVTRVWCDPHNHWLQGHAAWHVLSALSLLFTARHHARVTDGAMLIASTPP
jgi:predicted membrane channel-forming protein YqfA (hemolysin III family)